MAKCKNLKVCILARPIIQLRLNYYYLLTSFTVISIISMPDFSDCDSELLSITVCMQTLQGAVNARQREKEMQGRWRMKKLGKTEPHVVSRETHMLKSEGLKLFFEACMGAQLESQTLWNETMKSTKLAFYVTL